MSSARAAGVLAGWLLVVMVHSASASGDEPPAAPAPLAIEWDSSTLRLIERGADYGRMARLGDGGVGCVFDRDGKMWFRVSRDGGATFGPPTLVAADPDCWLTNADLLPLRDGALLYFWNERPLAGVKYQGRKAPPGVLVRPFLIRMSRSDDNGKTWSPPRTLYTAGPSYDDGCWEPAAVEMPDGEVRLQFSNEFPYQTTDEQEISMMRSPDGGKTWTDAVRVSLRPGHRDGMPAPLVLADARVVFAIEDNGQEGGGGRFKPSVVDADTGQRWPALKQPLPRDWYAGAPFLRRLPGPAGATLLSFQVSATGRLEDCRLAVCVGDADARNFAGMTYPLPPPARDNQAWGSLFVKDATTVTAMTTATIDGTRGLWAIDGRLGTARRASGAATMPASMPTTKHSMTAEQARLALLKMIERGQGRVPKSVSKRLRDAPVESVGPHEVQIDVWTIDLVRETFGVTMRNESVFLQYFGDLRRGDDGSYVAEIVGGQRGHR